jgi:DNA-binding transcriptional LysR family regulator
VAHSGSIARAATRLGMEPTTLTRHIGRLEKEIGAKLFHRSGRGMVLTGVGTQLLEEAAKVVAMLDSTRRIAAELGAGGPARIVLAAQPTIAHTCFGPVAMALQSDFPRAKIRVHEAYGHELVGWLQDGGVDICLMYVSSAMQASLDYELLLQEQLYCVTPPGFAVPDVLDTRAVLDLPLVLPSTAFGLRGLVETWAASHGKALNLAMECDGSTYMTRRLVQAGAGCTVLPLASVHEEVAAGRLAAKRIEGLDALRSVALATAKNGVPLPGLWEIVRTTKKVIGDLVRAGQWAGVDRMVG